MAVVRFVGAESVCVLGIYKDTLFTLLRGADTRPRHSSKKRVHTFNAMQNQHLRSVVGINVQDRDRNVDILERARTPRA